MEEKKVNLFLVGAMKAGTTSLVEILSKHPDIYVSPIKEPHFFVDALPKQLYEPSRFFNLEKYLEKTFPQPLHITKIETLKQYKKVYSLINNQKYLLDASTMYLHAPEVAQKIYQYNPQAKIIIIKRNPLKRAFSHYNMLVGLSREKRTFNEVIHEEIIHYNNNNLKWYSCLGMSFYNSAIKEYKKLFKEVLVLDFETLIQNQPLVYKQLQSFLNLNFKINQPLIKKNVSRTPRFKNLFFFLHKIGIKDYFSVLFSSNFKQQIYRLLSSNKKEEPMLTLKVKQELENIFKKES